MWIKSWARTEEHKKYIVLAAGLNSQGKEYFYRPTIMFGWEVKRLIEGCYVALEVLVPGTLDDCE